MPDDERIQIAREELDVEQQEPQRAQAAGPPVDAPSRLAGDARVRARLSWLWAVVGVIVGIAVLLVASDGPAGRTLRVAGVLLLVGAVVAVLTAIVNRGLIRGASRTDLGGPADLGTLTLAVALLVGVVATLLVGRPLGLAHLAILMLMLAAYLSLGLLTVGTGLASRR